MKQSMNFRPSPLWLAMMLAMTLPALAQDNTTANQANAPDEAAVQLDTLTVTGQETPLNTGMEDVILRRGARNLADLLDQASGVTLNGLYTRPDISISIQGLGGHGRVTQQLEGITQQFQAFSHNLDQTGTILVDPALLRAIDIQQGATSDAGTLGNIAGSANFTYLEADDVLLPGKDIGGLVRLSRGLGEYSNGNRLGGSAFFAARNDNWELVVGGAHTDNKDFRIGNSISSSDLLGMHHQQYGLRVIHQAFVPDSANGGYRVDWRDVYQKEWNENGYNITQQIYEHNPLTGAHIEPAYLLRFDPGVVNALKKVSNAFPGSWRETDSGMVRLRYSFNDAYDQRLELFATQTDVAYQTDVAASIRVPNVTGGPVEWTDPATYVDTSSLSRMFSLKYSAAVSDLFNPEVMVFYQTLEREQYWPAIIWEGYMLHSKPDTDSTGLRLGNTSYLAALGGWKLNTGLEIRRMHFNSDDFSEDDANVVDYFGWAFWESWGQVQWNPESRNDAFSASFNLSSDNNSPWQVSLGAGIQHLQMDVYEASVFSGNVRQAGTWYDLSNVSSGYMTREEWDAQNVGFFIDPGRPGQYSNGHATYQIQDTEHSWNLLSANLHLQYTLSNTGWSLYGQVAYGERAPTSGELYTHGTYYRARFDQNYDLEPETNLSLQAGIRYLGTNLLTSGDYFSLDAKLYRNNVQNFIGVGYSNRNHTAVDPGYANQWGGNDYSSSYFPYGNWSRVNNTEDWITQGFTLDMAYQQPLFYLRSNLTVPFEYLNSFCYDQFPGGEGYYYQNAKDENGNSIVIFTEAGTGSNACANPFKWTALQTIEPVQGSLTAAFTPLQGRLELGGVFHYRGRQRSYFYVSPADADSGEGTAPIAIGKFGIMNRWPAVMKFDLFANYQLNDQLKLGLYFANITDQMDITPHSEYISVLPGRTLTASVEFRF